MKRDEFEDDPAAAAFEELRAEVTVTRKDVAALHDQIEANRPPDYGVDLAEMKQVIADLAKQIEVLAKRPGLASPEAHAREIARAGELATQQAVKALSHTQDEFEKQKNELAQWVAEARTADSQIRWLLVTATASLAFGVLAGTLIVTRTW